MGAGLTNGIAAIIVGVYIGAAFLSGNGSQLLTEVEKDKGFVVWILAIIVFLSVKDLMPPKAAAAILAMVLIGFLIRTGDKLFPAINKFLGSA